MAHAMQISNTLRAETSTRTSSSTIDAARPRDEAGRGLLITADSALARTFRRELRRCAECSLTFDVRSNFEEALRESGGPYRWVGVDLDGAIAPSEAVRLARFSWPAAPVAVLSCWWSERDTIARELADVVIHKPVRSTELLALLSAAAPQADEALPAATG